MSVISLFPTDIHCLGANDGIDVHQASESSIQVAKLKIWPHTINPRPPKTGGVILLSDLPQLRL